MASGRLADYLGRGPVADRPTTLDLHPEAVGFWFDAATGLSAWDGTAWTSITSGGSGGVDSVNGQSGVVVLDAADVGAATAAQGALADSATQPGDLATVATTGNVDDLTGFPGGTTHFLRADGTFAAPPSGGSAVWGGITGTLSSQTDLQTALDAKAADRSAVTALSIASGVVNIDCALGDFFTLSLTSNVTSITFSNLPASGFGASLALRVRQDATGNRTLALPSSFKATGGSDTAVQSAANSETLITLLTFDQGTRWAYAMQEVAP